MFPFSSRGRWPGEPQDSQHAQAVAASRPTVPSPRRALFGKRHGDFPDAITQGTSVVFWDPGSEISGRYGSIRPPLRDRFSAKNFSIHPLTPPISPPAVTIHAREMRIHRSPTPVSATFPALPLASAALPLGRKMAVKSRRMAWRGHFPSGFPAFPDYGVRHSFKATV